MPSTQPLASPPISAAISTCQYAQAAADPGLVAKDPPAPPAWLAGYKFRYPVRVLGKVAEFFEREVDDTVAGLSQLLEPMIMVFLGVVIGGLVVAMYLPIFKLGAVVGG